MNRLPLKFKMFYLITYVLLDLLLERGQLAANNSIVYIHANAEIGKPANEGKKENVDEYNKRFRKECEMFLSDSLGLRDLCFPQEFVDEHK